MSDDRASHPRAADTPGDIPLVSVVMANYRGAAHLGAAMRSVLAQSERRLELIVADDASGDDSVAIARRIAEDEGDGRVRVIASDRNQGPAGTRNLALVAARGEWIAIVDSDDLIHPERIARLIAAAQARGADMAADDLVYFGAPDQRGRTLLQSLSLDAPMMLTTAMMLRGNGGDPKLPSFGYLKPVIRRAALDGRRYDPDLRIGEDYDLVLRLLIGGAGFLLLPDPLYAYRRHAGSVSHRLSAPVVEAMLVAHEALPPLTDPDARRAAAAVRRQLRGALRYERLVEDIKARRPRALARLADPGMLARLGWSLRDRRRRKNAEQADEACRPAPALPALPEMPDPGQRWSAPPAVAAAAISAGAPVPPQAPGWARWLAGATG